MNNLKQRWFRDDLLRTKELIIDALLKGKSVADIKGVEVFEGRSDLRGISFSENNDYHFRNLKLKDIDLSFASLRELNWEHCSFENIVFLEAQAEDIKFWACEFDKVLLKRTNLKGALLNGCLDNKHGMFKNVDFIESNLRDSSYVNTLFEDTKFVDCNLDHVDFNGSRFNRCKFFGRLIEVLFRGFPVINYQLNPKFTPLNNKMTDVDFTQAHLESVMFLDSIDLSRCSFPTSSDYVIIKRNRNKVFEMAREQISSEWGGIERRMGLALIDQSYLSKCQVDKDMEVVDRFFLLKVNKEFGVQFFNLLNEINAQINEK